MIMITYYFGVINDDDDDDDYALYIVAVLCERKTLLSACAPLLLDTIDFKSLTFSADDRQYRTICQ